MTSWKIFDFELIIFGIIFCTSRLIFAFGITFRYLDILTATERHTLHDYRASVLISEKHSVELGEVEKKKKIKDSEAFNFFHSQIG